VVASAKTYSMLRQFVTYFWGRSQF
jgi:hypothetical protein